MADAHAAELLGGGGEMGALVRAMDWSASALGPIDRWPQSLRTTASTCLNSRFPIFIWWGPELITLYNDAYRDILGDKHPRALGRSARDVWPEIWSVIGPMIEAVRERGEATWSENQRLELIRKGFAEETYFTFSYSPIHDESNQVGGVYATVAETTRQMIGERRLRLLSDLSARTAAAKQADEACRLAGDVLADASADLPYAIVYLVDREGRRAERVCTAGAVPERAWPIDDAIAGGSIARVEDALVIPAGRSGDERPSIVLVAGLSPRLVLDDPYRDFLRLVAEHVATAVGGARALDDARQRAEALAELDRAKTAFFSNVSHEFRTPLTLMLGPQEDALATPDRALAGDALDAVHRNTLRLLRLVNTLLDFSRIEAGRIQASYEACDLATLTCDLASAFRAAIEGGGLRLEVDCAPIDGPVFVDREMWEKIVLNLLSNAFKFTFEGTIRVVLRQDGDRATLVVADTGVGIPQAELGRVFQRFYRIEGSRSRTHEGTGIGLALVHDLVTLHGGAIEVASDEGRGTTFTVSLPIGHAHLPAERLAAAPVLRAQRTDTFVGEAMRWSVEAPRRETSGGVNVLVADDNADMREYLARLLRQHGWTVDTVADGASALAAIRATRPELVLADVMMPMLDGFGLLRAIRDDAAIASTPVVMLSARAGEDARVEGLAAGADDYLVKPFSAKELIARVSTHLQIARLRAQAERTGERLHELLMRSPVAIAVFSGPDHRFELANARYRQMIRRDDVVGRTLTEVFPELAGTPVIEILDRVYATGEPYSADAYPLRLRRDGREIERFFQFDLLPTRDRDGAVSGWMCTVADVTEQVRARKAIEQSEARFRRIFESNMIGFVFSNLDGRVLDANDYFLRMLDVTRDDVLGGNVRWDDRTPPEYRALAGRTVAELREHGVVAPHEKEYLRADGTRVPVVFGASVLPGTDRETVTWVLDISDRKRVESQLALLAEASRVIASSIDPEVALATVARLCAPVLGDGCGIYLVDDAGEVTIAASHHVDAARHAIARDLVGRRPIDRAAPSGLGYVIGTGRPWLSRELSDEARAQIAADDVSRAALARYGLRSSVIVPLYAEGRVLGAMGFSITESDRRFDEKDLVLAEELARRVALAIHTGRLHRERLELLERERHARAEAENASRAKDEFLAMLGHELRNPLAPILTALQIMRLRGTSAVERELTVMERQTQHLVRLVDDLLDVSRITRGKVELKRAHVELAEVVAEAIEIASPLIEQRRHRLDVDVPARGLTVDADRSRLAQVVSNLLTNAAKYTEGGGQITLAAARDGDHVRLVVRDTGIGIEPGMLPRVFDLFAQERQALDRSQGGLGLGLAIVKSLVLLHGGSVEVDSAGRGRGTSFTVRLPAVGPAAAAAHADGASASPSAARDGHRILVVDDNEDAADLLAEYLGFLGHVTRVAHDGPAALRVVEEFAPEIAVLDIGLPVMDGYELARRLRAGDDHLRLIAVTGYGQDADKRRAREASFDAHLVKPISAERLEVVIRDLFKN